MHVTADSMGCEKQRAACERACRVNFDFEQHAIIVAGCLFAEGGNKPPQKMQTHALTVNLEEEIAKSAACSLLFVGRGSFALCLRRSNVCQKAVLSV